MKMRHKSVELMTRIQVYAERFQLEYHRSPSTSEIATALGIVKSTVYKYLVEMDEKGMLSYRDGNIVTEKTRKIATVNVSAAILGSVSCGIPQLEEEYVEEYVSLPVALFGKGEFFILRAKGESMIDAGIDDGDLVVIKKQLSATEGQIVVALIENETTLKRFFLDRDKRCIRLHPENKEMSDIYVSECSIQGIAIHVIKSLV